MMRLATPERKRFGQSDFLQMSFGGGEANVAVSLANYGKNVSFVTRLPENDWGKAVVADLKKYGVNTDNIVFGGQRLGIYFLETGSVMRPSKVIYDRANSSFAEISINDVDWDKVYKNAEWFHWTGITPAVSDNAAKVCMHAIKVAKQYGVTVSCDLNYRKNLWKYGKTATEVMTELVGMCDVIIGNEEDAEKVFGIKANDVDVNKAAVEAQAYEYVGRKICEKFPLCKIVAITLRGSISADYNTWSGVLWDKTKLFTAPQYQISDIVDRVGAGDSFVGGLIYGLIEFKHDYQKVLNFAVAASALKHTIHGDYNMVTVAEVEQLMKGNASGRVIR